MKLLAEGYRTRDGHMIEWFGRIQEPGRTIAVLSRPEPHLLRPLTRTARNKPAADNTQALDSYSWAIPNVLDRRRWWTQSRNSYRLPAGSVGTPAVIWNPLVGISNVWNELRAGDRKIAVDLLDDWTIHYAFASIRPQLELAYRQIFDRADIVTANAEGTLALAQRFGRSDAILLTNGVDPDRFASQSHAEGPIKIGYVGKIGKRLNLELIEDCAQSLPELEFIFAGPILDKDYAPALRKQPNVRLLGDVHYDEVPALLQTFDVGWVPHNVGAFEVGGDVIKTYEYRAAHLPVLSTPVAGAGQRSLESVYVLPAAEHSSWLKQKTFDRNRLPREAGSIPENHTWRHKAEFILSRLNA